jgi:hypothetical protein
MPVILKPGRLREEDYKFQAGMGYIVRPSLNKTKQNKTKSKISFSTQFTHLRKSLGRFNKKKHTEMFSLKKTKQSSLKYSTNV